MTTRTKHVLLCTALLALVAGGLIERAASREGPRQRPREGSATGGARATESPADPPRPTPTSSAGEATRRPIMGPPATPPPASFGDLVTAFARLTDEQLVAAIGEVNREIAERRLVERANEARLDDRERDDLRLLLRRHNALQAARAERLLESASREGI
jgi:hypothetical protein